jgi:type IV pilus assembly protein PilN
MIKINLLLARKEKKKAALGKEVIILILSVVLLLVLLGLIQWTLGKEKENIRAQISETKREIDRHKSLTTELNQHKEELKRLQDRLNIINTLKKEKASPAKVLDELSIDKPEKLQLESLKKTGSKLGIEGIALDDETIVTFMTNLRKSKLFKNVDLIVSEQIEQNKIKVRKFILSCEIIPT